MDQFLLIQMLLKVCLHPHLLPKSYPVFFIFSQNFLYQFIFAFRWILKDSSQSFRQIKACFCCFHFCQLVLFSNAQNWFQLSIYLQLQETSFQERVHQWSQRWVCLCFLLFLTQTLFPLHRNSLFQLTLIAFLAFSNQSYFYQVILFLLYFAHLHQKLLLVLLLIYFHQSKNTFFDSFCFNLLFFASQYFFVYQIMQKDLMPKTDSLINCRHRMKKKNLN